MAQGEFHTRFVGWMKIILPVIALGLLSTLFLLSRTVDPTQDIPVTEVDLEQRAQDQGASNRQARPSPWTFVIKRLGREMNGREASQQIAQREERRPDTGRPHVPKIANAGDGRTNRLGALWNWLVMVTEAHRGILP